MHPAIRCLIVNQTRWLLRVLCHFKKGGAPTPDPEPARRFVGKVEPPLETAPGHAAIPAGGHGTARSEHDAISPMRLPW